MPITNERSVNVTTGNLGGFHISYNPSSRDYGCPTTAIVLQGRVFLVLNGDHTEALALAVENGELPGAIDYFIGHIAQANTLSEHRMVTGEAADPFLLSSTAVEMLGQVVIDRLKSASRAARDVAPA